MARMTDETLLLWIAGALDPGRMLEVDHRVACSADLARRVDALRAACEPEPAEPEPEPLAPPTPAWALPPPGYWRGTPPLRLSPAAHAVMGDEGLAPGSRVPVDLDLTGSGPDATVVVLFRENGGWRVIFPTSPGKVVRTGDLPRSDTGTARLDLVARPGGGRQRFAVALVPPAVPIRWDSADRWAAVRDALGDGRARVASVELTVGR